MLWIQFAVLISMILIGSRMKGIGLGVMGVIGMLIFVLVFHLRPTAPPLDVMMIIMAIVTTGAALQASGGLDYLVYVAEKIIRRNPSQITFVAPFTAYVLCLFAGTAHIVYSLLPVISEVATQKRIRPERPLSISVIASHVALTGSPMSACVAAFAVILGYPGAAIDIIKIGLPAGVIGVIAGALSVWKMGKDLDKDPVFLEKMKDPEFVKSLEVIGDSKQRTIKPGAKTAVAIFGVAVFTIVLCGAFPSIVPNFGSGEANFSVKADGTLTMVTVIEIVTLSAAAIIMLVNKVTPAEVAKSSLFTAMAAAVVSVFGVVWMSSTFIANNQELIKNSLGGIAQAHPWTFTFAVFAMAALVFSQAGTTKTMMPLGVTLGITSPHLIAMFVAVNADFTVPGYPTLLAAIQFDRTGSTKIGKFVVNHSFMLPGLVTITVAVIAGFVLSNFLL
jgi:anaerobic C4-dicarboxylate transporter DcuA